MTDDPVTPNTILKARRNRLDDSDTEDSDLIQLLTPETRFRLLDALLSISGDPLTERQIAEEADISQASANRHLKDLLDADLAQQVDKVGNARRYRANTDHPLVQLLAMADNILRFGTSTQLLDEQWIDEHDYEPGDHPSDPRE